MEWFGVSLLMADHTLPPRPCLAEKMFFLRSPPGWFRLDFTPSLTNAKPYGSVFLSSSYLESLDWALGPTYAQIWVAWPFTPTIAHRDPFFLLHWGKGGSRCDSCPLFPLFYHSWMWSVFWTIQAASLTFWYTRCAFIKFLWIHVPHFKWRDADPMVGGLH